MKKALATILALVMALGLTTISWADEATNYVTVNGGETKYTALTDAIEAATPDDNGVITYTITGKVDISGSDQWISFVKSGTSGVKTVKFIGLGTDAEISITSSGSILGVQNMDIDVSFENLKLTHPNGKWVNDLGHATNYFSCMVRTADKTVTYTNCTFPNGVCNNQYGKTVFDNCKFTNNTASKYNLWNYGGNTEVKDSKFTGTRGIKAYNEGTLKTAPTISISNTEFNGLTEKAAIVVSKATDVTIGSISADSCTKGLIQKSIEGSTSEQEVTIAANGNGISGTFNITAAKEPEKAKEEFNITAGTFTADVSDYVASSATAATVDNSYCVGAETIKEAAKTADSITVKQGTIEGGLTVKDGATVKNDTNTALTVNGKTVAGGTTEVIKTEQPPRYYYNSTTTTDTKADDTKGSPKTFDAGVGIYAVTAVLSVTGMAWTAKKRED